MSKKKDDKKKPRLLSTNATAGENRRARFDYDLEDTFEAGLMLKGTEVKSLRHGQCSIAEAYIGPTGTDLYLHNCHIPEYSQAPATLQHEPKRIRKLLLHRRELDKLLGHVQRDGYTLVPLKIFFNARGMAKLLFALARGKKLHDKRETTKQRDWNRDKQRIMRERG